MKNKEVNGRFGILIFLICFLLGTSLFYSCKAPRSVTSLKLKPISTGKIIKNLNEKPSGFDQLSIKRISCQVSGTSANTSFRATLKLVKDEKILISFSKINIPVGGILLTPDSVKYVNYVDRQFFRGDYEFVHRTMNLNIDFQDLQSLLFNNFFSYSNNPESTDLDEYKSFIDSGLYVLQSINNRKLSKFYNKWQSKKVDRFLKRKNEEALNVQTIYIEPVNFNIVKIVFEDKNNNNQLEFNFGDFTIVDGKEYPGAIDFNYNSKEEKLNIGIKMSGFSTEETGGFDLKIPEKYQPVVLKN